MSGDKERRLGEGNEWVYDGEREVIVTQWRKDVRGGVSLDSAGRSVKMSSPK